MPIYEYVCRECGFEFEHMQSFSAHGHPPCPNCQSMHISRMLSKPAIHFKGSGWYITDSKNSSRQSANGEGAADKSGETPSEKSPAPAAGEEAPPAKGAAGEAAKKQEGSVAGAPAVEKTAKPAE